MSCTWSRFRSDAIMFERKIKEKKLTATLFEFGSAKFGYHYSELIDLN